jgi:7-cyano-7-deazaguanine reductase
MSLSNHASLFQWIQEQYSINQRFSTADICQHENLPTRVVQSIMTRKNDRAPSDVVSQLLDKSIKAGLLFKGSEGTSYKYEGADSSLLETFPNPMSSVKHGKPSIEVTAPEFTSLCPLTGQPDFATIVINYVPNELCVESKAWKLYLGSFRNVGEFHESCVTRIAQDLIDLLDPIELTVHGQFTPRGGIPFWPKIEYSKPLTVEV